MAPVEQSSAYVLIVEDDFGIRDAVTQILEDEGYTVVGVTNGMEALDYLRNTPDVPALILLDLTLPLMSGWQFISMCQQDSALRSIPIMVMSADSSFLHTISATGAAGYLQKPIEINTLLDTVRQYCGQG
ncbi:MAG: hypothetical protein KatS3mg057_2928 [Herpetosiphonaceae bacterium]|nr:MAG: hypothetical protein KatS3mg057_2928 [Herpetosiphonaceae bacterium]